jgi:ActR/RegA family two-component response regulator
LATQPAPIVLLVDSDLGFVFWLGQALDAAGFQAVPAKNVADAVSLITEHHVSVNLVIFNAAFANAVPLLSALQSSTVKFIAVVPEGVDQGSLPGVDAIRQKPGKLNQHSRREWVNFIQNVIGGRVATG